MKKTKRFAYLLICAVLAAAFIPASAYAQDSTLAGHWVGTIEVPTMKLDVIVDFSQNEGGAWSGSISIPAQNAKDLPLTKILLKGKDIAFEISGVPGKPVFKGVLSDDDASMKGSMTQGGKSFPFSLKREASPADKAKTALAGFDDIVNRGLKSLNVPGAAVAIVVNNEVVLAKGFGFRNVEKKLAMTPDTLLAIGSSSKAFTTFALGTLVDEGKLDWDKPVRNSIPWFKLFDASATERLTPRDLVTHRSGLPRHDLVWYNNSAATRENLVRRLAYLKPTADLREKFQYNNLMFLTAGYLLEVLTEKSWEDAVRAQVLTPLEMTRTNFSVEDSQKDDDFSPAYTEEKGAVKRIPFRNITTIGPAGAINSSVNELSRWVLVHLNQGKLNGKQLIAASTIEDMHLAHMPMGNPQELPEITPASYGMGWFIDSYRGHPRVYHGGNIDGFSALVCMMPQDGIGFAVLTNMNGTPLPDLLALHAADLILGFPSKDWIGESAKKKTSGEAALKEAEKKKLTRRMPGTKPAHKLDDYAGDYNQPGYGDLKVAVKNGKLFFTYNGMTTELEHWHYETFNGKRIDDPTFSDMKLTFRTNANGFVEAIEAPFEPTLDNIVFMRKPDARQFDPAYLKPFEGKYTLVNETVTVALRGTVLTVSVPGQPVFDLQPVIGGEFVLKQVPIIGIKFKTDNKGAVTAMEMSQPKGVFEAKKIKE